jgi:CrcB protein
LVLAVSAGGALGAGARYGVGVGIPVRPDSFPWATLLVNVSGALVLGVALMILLERFGPSRYLRAFVGTGFCGAYTTMSTLGVETSLLARADRYLLAASYVAVSVVGGLAAAWLGMHVGRRMSGLTDVRRRIGGER